MFIVVNLCKIWPYDLEAYVLLYTFYKHGNGSIEIMKWINTNTLKFIPSHFYSIINNIKKENNLWLFFSKVSPNHEWIHTLFLSLTTELKIYIENYNKNKGNDWHSNLTPLMKNWTEKKKTQVNKVHSTQESNESTTT